MEGDGHGLGFCGSIVLVMCNLFYVYRVVQ